MLVIEKRGSTKKTTDFLHRMATYPTYTRLAEYGQLGCQLLAKNTPKDSGETAESWNYQIVEESDRVRLVWTNSNNQNGMPVVLLLQYGHATRNGAYIEGIDFINPALAPVMNTLAERLWKDVK